MKILNPLGTPREAAARALPTVGDFAGLRLGVLTNHWKSMDRVAQRISVRARERYGATVSLYDIPINGPMSEAVEKAALNDCGAVIVGLAN